MCKKKRKKKANKIMYLTVVLTKNKKRNDASSCGIC